VALVNMDPMLSLILTALAAQMNGSPLYLRLYQNNHTPHVGDGGTPAAYTEANFDGYAPVAISSWSGLVIVSHIGAIYPSAIIFTKTVGPNPNNIYGYYVTNLLGTVLYWAELDPSGPIPMIVAGSQYQVVLQQSQQSLNV
jgi:hypothetical protein